MVILTFGFTSCSNDDDEEANSLIVGTWVSNNNINNGKYNFLLKLYNDNTASLYRYEGWQPANGGNYQEWETTEYYTYIYDGKNLKFISNESNNISVVYSVTFTNENQTMVLCEEGATAADDCLSGYFVYTRK